MYHIATFEEHVADMNDFQVQIGHEECPICGKKEMEIISFCVIRCKNCDYKVGLYA